MSSGAIAPSAPAPSSPAALVLTPEQMTTAILELRQAVAGIRAFLAVITAPVISYQYRMPYDGTVMTSFPAVPLPFQGVPIQQIKFPPSPSPLLAWIAGSSKPIYTAPSTQPHLLPLLATGAVLAPDGAPAPDGFYGRVDGPLFHGGSLMPTLSVALAGQTGAAPSAAA